MKLLCCEQVVDARDPFFYWSEDLAAYALELHPSKRSLMVLNKADLLPADVRLLWSDYLTERGIDHVFWSAKSAIDALSGTWLVDGCALCLHARPVGECLQQLYSKGGATLSCCTVPSSQRDVE